MKYLLDTSIFIEANRRYYHYETVPSFWQWLSDDDDLVTIQAVIDEIKRGTDNLIDLVRGVQIIDQVDNSYDFVLQYTLDRYKISQDQLSRNDETDLTLIAVAHKKKFTVVTCEVKEKETKTKPKIKIPDVCEGMKVKCEIDIFETLKRKRINLSNYTSPN